MNDANHDDKAASRARIVGLLLAGAVVAAYAPSLRGGFLNYDDPWLIENNPVLAMPAGPALTRIWFDLSTANRFTLGAEYLPVRDTMHWLAVQSFGLIPGLLRIVRLGLYVAAVLLVRRYLGITVGAGRLADGAAFLFALHPIHVESVAWLAGSKDVLALLFTTAALVIYAESSGRRLWWVAPLVLLACLSKAVAVVTPVLLLTHDLWVRRRPPSRGVIALCCVAAGAALAVHLFVGSRVGMTTPPVGGNRLAAAATMGPVWLRYLANLLRPVNLSIIYDVPVRTAGDPIGWAAYGVLGAWIAAGEAARRAGNRLPLAAATWFIVPLLPTSQIAAPLQNLMADRYLLLAALGPCLLAAALLAGKTGRWCVPLVVLLSTALAGGTAARAWVFGDSVRLWTDAAGKSSSPRAPFQLAAALQERGNVAGAEAAFREAVTRAPPSGDDGRMARNSLATLLANQGRLPEAEAELRRARDLHPQDPKILNNLAEVVSRRGDEAAARVIYDELLRRFPAYQVGRRNYLKKYGVTDAPALPAP